MFVVQARTLVGHRQPNPILGPLQRHGHLAAGRADRQRVVQQVVQDLLDRTGHHRGPHGPLGAIEAQRHVGAVGHRRPGVDAVGGDDAHVGAFGGRRLIGTGQLQQIAHQVGEAPGFVDRRLHLGALAALPQLGGQVLQPQP